jgi:perosamine synthetase
LYAVRLNLDTLNITRAEFIDELRQKGVCASVHFIPISLLSFFAPYAHLPQNNCPNALTLFPRLVSIPLYPGLTDEDVARVARSIREIAATFTKTRAARPDALLAP